MMIPWMRVDSMHNLEYRVTGDVTLSVFVMAYYMTEPS